MDERIKMILNSPDENGECEAIELELEGLTDEIDARLNEIDDTLFFLQIIIQVHLKYQYYNI